MVLYVDLKTISDGNTINKTRYHITLPSDIQDDSPATTRYLGYENVDSSGVVTSEFVSQLDIASNSVSVSLDKMSFHHEMHNPFKLNLELTITGAQEISQSSFKEIALSFYRSAYSLEIYENRVYSNLVVTDIKYKLLKSSSTVYKLYLVLHTPDYFMTLDKRSKCYTGYTFRDIASESVGRFNNIAVSAVNLSNLIDVDASGAETEHLLPYAVQYQECTFDFLSRIARRYGEFMYYSPTDNLLHFGCEMAVDSSGKGSLKTVSNESYVSIDYHGNVSDLFHDQVHTLYRASELTNSRIVSEATGKIVSDYGATDVTTATLTNLGLNAGRSSTTVFDCVSSVYAYDDYNQSNDFDTKYSKPTKFLSAWKTFLSTALDSPDIVTGFKMLKSKMILTAWVNSASAGYSNELYDEIKDSTQNESYYRTIDKSSTAYKKYTEAYRDLDETKLSTALLALIELNSEYVRNNMITIDYGATSVADFALAHKFILGSDRYLISSIEYEYDGVTCSSKATALPILVSNGVELLFPAKVDAPLVRESKSQVAFVVDSYDPSGLNRVRVKYPWQFQYTTASARESATADIATKKSALETATETYETNKTAANKTAKESAETAYKDAVALLDSINKEFSFQFTKGNIKYEDYSPWIRLSVPMASSGGSGLNFMPNIGDEVMVGYEHGNIERPYIEGLLFSAQRKPSNSTNANMYKYIKSSNGHTLTFYDNPDAKDFLYNMLPVGPLLSGFGAGGDFMTDANSRKLSGYTMISDANGMYNLKLSSDERKITIASPFGTVSVSAFEGITLSAPNGDIKIKGKNISLEAGNDISIVSGANIKNFPWQMKYKTVGAYVDLAVNRLVLDALGAILDIGFSRTVLESLIRPLGGSLLIKSHRNVLVEAGDGSAELEDLNDGDVENINPMTLECIKKFGDFMALLRRKFTNKKKNLNKSITQYLMNRTSLKDEMTAGQIDLASMPSGHSFDEYLPELEVVSYDIAQGNIFEFIINAQYNVLKTEVDNFLAPAAGGAPAVVPAAGGGVAPVVAVAAAVQQQQTILMTKMQGLMGEYEAIMMNNANVLLLSVFRDASSTHDFIRYIYSFVIGAAAVPAALPATMNATAVRGLVRSLVHSNENVAREAYCACMIRFGDYIKDESFGVAAPPAPQPQPNGNIFNLTQDKVSSKMPPILLNFFGGDDVKIDVPTVGTALTDASSGLYKNWDRICHSINHNLVRTGEFEVRAKKNLHDFFDDEIGIGKSSKGQFDAIFGRNGAMSGKGNILMSSDVQYSTMFDPRTASFVKPFAITTAIAEALKVQI